MAMSYVLAEIAEPTAKIGMSEDNQWQAGLRERECLEGPLL